MATSRRMTAIAGLFALVAIGGVAAAGAEQNEAQAEPLVSEEELLAKAPDRRLVATWLESLRATSTLPAGQDASEPSLGTGLLVDLDGPASLRVLPVPSEDERLLLTPAAARRLLLAPAENRLSIPRLDDALLLFRVHATASPERTVPPDVVMDTPVPGAFRELPGYTPRPSTMPAAARACALSQSLFFKNIEGELRNGILALNRSKDEWKILSDTAKAFDGDCLERIPVAASDPVGVPLDRLAVLIDPDKGSFCMAAYLGDGRFVTANHCRFDAVDAPRRDILVSLADGSKLNLPVQFADTVRPISARGADDWAVLVAPALHGHHPSSVLRAVVPAVHKDVRLIGYFGLADIAATAASGHRPLWKDALRATRDIGIHACRIVDVASNDAGGGCMMHDCQSLPGFSGAPLFARASDGSWGLAGIHVAAAEADIVAACPAFAGNAYFARAGNIAAGVPSAIAVQMNSGS